MIIDRREMRDRLANIISILMKVNSREEKAEDKK